MDSRNEQEISQIIEECLTAVLSGEATLDAILARYPEHSQLLRAEVEMALWCVTQRDEVNMRAGFVKASRKRLVDRIQAETGVTRQKNGKRASLGMFWPGRVVMQFAAALTIFVLLFLSSYGAVSASRGSLPGDSFYPVKRIAEDVQYAFTLNPVERVQLSLEFSNRRLDEMEVLITRGQYNQATDALSDFEFNINQSLALLVELKNSANQPEVAILDHTKAELTRQTEQITYLLSVAPESAQKGLTRALNVSQHGFETASQMRNNPNGGPGYLITKTKPSKNSGDQPGNGQGTPPANGGPTVGDVTITPSPTVEKVPGNLNKPTRTPPADKKDPKPTNENRPTRDTENNGPPLIDPPGHDK